MLPTYPNYINFPSLLQGSGLPFVFQVTDTKIPIFLHNIPNGEALTVTSGTLIEIDFNVLKMYKEYAILQEENISLVHIGYQEKGNVLKVYGKSVYPILTADKVYVIKIVMSDNSEFYTDIFQYCSKNQT